MINILFFSLVITIGIVTQNATVGGVVKLTRPMGFTKSSKTDSSKAIPSDEILRTTPSLKPTNINSSTHKSIARAATQKKTSDFELTTEPFAYPLSTMDIEASNTTAQLMKAVNRLNFTNLLSKTENARQFLNWMKPDYPKLPLRSFEGFFVKEKPKFLLEKESAEEPEERIHVISNPHIIENYLRRRNTMRPRSMQESIEDYRRKRKKKQHSTSSESEDGDDESLGIDRRSFDAVLDYRRSRKKKEHSTSSESSIEEKHIRKSKRKKKHHWKYLESSKEEKKHTRKSKRKKKHVSKSSESSENEGTILRRFSFPLGSLLRRVVDTSKEKIYYLENIKKGSLEKPDVKEKIREEVEKLQIKPESIEPVINYDDKPDDYIITTRKDVWNYDHEDWAAITKVVNWSSENNNQELDNSLQLKDIIVGPEKPEKKHDKSAILDEPLRNIGDDGKRNTYKRKQKRNYSRKDQIATPGKKFRKNKKTVSDGHAKQKRQFKRDNPPHGKSIYTTERNMIDEWLNKRTTNEWRRRKNRPKKTKRTKKKKRKETVEDSMNIDTITTKRFRSHELLKETEAKGFFRGKKRPVHKSRGAISDFDDSREKPRYRNSDVSKEYIKEGRLKSKEIPQTGVNGDISDVVDSREVKKVPITSSRERKMNRFKIKTGTDEHKDIDDRNSKPDVEIDTDTNRDKYKERNDRESEREDDNRSRPNKHSKESTKDNSGGDKKIRYDSQSKEDTRVRKERLDRPSRERVIDIKDKIDKPIRGRSAEEPYKNDRYQNDRDNDAPKKDKFRDLNKDDHKKAYADENFSGRPANKDWGKVEPANKNWDKEGVREKQTDLRMKESADKDWGKVYPANKNWDKEEGVREKKNLRIKENTDNWDKHSNNNWDSVGKKNNDKPKSFSRGGAHKSQNNGNNGYSGAHNSQNKGNAGHFGYLRTSIPSVHKYEKFED